jgi:hypothetical protein
LQVDCDQNMLCSIQLRRHDRGCQESADSDEVGKRGRKVGRDQVGIGKNGAPHCRVHSHKCQEMDPAKNN